jgi:CHAT domain-containing protein
MKSETLAELLAGYALQPNAPIAFPSDPPGRRVICDQAKREIRSALMADQVTSAENLVRFAWEVARQTGEEELCAWAHWCEGLWLINRQPRPALEHLEKACQFYRGQARDQEAGRVLIGIAGLLGQMGRLEEAFQAIQECIHALRAYPDYPDWPVIYLNLSDIQGRRGDYAAMRASAARAEELARQNQADYFVIEAMINQGFAATLLVDSEMAAGCFTQARDAAQASGYSEAFGRAELNLAHLAIDQGRLFEGYQRLQRTRQAYEQAQIELEQGEVALAQARVFEQLCMPREARRAASFATETFRSAVLVRESILAGLYAARLALLQGEIERARRLLRQARQQPGEISPEQDALLLAYESHPSFQKNRAQRQAALSKAQMAAQTLQRLGLKQEVLESEQIQAELGLALNLPDIDRRLSDLAGQAQSHAWQAQEIWARERLARRLPAMAAIRELRRAADLAAGQRQQMPVEELKANLLSGQLGLYRQLIACQLKCDQPWQAAQTLLEAKGGLWADLLNPTHTPPADADWLQTLAEHRFWQEKQLEAQDPEYVSLCKNKLQHIEQRLSELARQQTRRRVPRPLPGLEQVTAALPENGAVLEYVLLDQDVAACLLAPGKPPLWRRLASQAGVLNRLDQLRLLTADLQSCASPSERLAASRQQQTTLDEILEALSQALIAPLAADLPSRGGTIAIVPDGFLFDLPWTALKVEGEWIGACWQLSMLPSSVLCALPPSAGATGQPLALGCAGNPPLFQVEAELKAIQSAWPEAACIFPAARGDLARAQAPAWLHIAAHARVRPHEPLLSSLELADGSYLLAEALQLPLSGTRWVALSACETGSLPERGGVALALAGSFLLAGAGAVIASLWAVDDAATQLLMSQLYQALHDGAALPEALQRAQGAVRAAGYAHPYYWAAFYALSGAM